MSRQSPDKRVSSLSAWFSFLALLLGSFCHGQDAASVERIWRERSARIKEIQLRWDEKLTHYTAPGVTAEGEGEFALSIDGRIRLLTDNIFNGASDPGARQQNVEPVAGKIVLARQLQAYDGVTCASLSAPQPGRAYHILGLSTGVVPRWDFIANMSALELFCRPFDNRNNALPGGLAGFQSRLDELDGVKVIVLEREGWTLWVTSDDRALVLRKLRKRGELPSSEIRARYAKDSDSGEWLPAGWDYKQFRVDGKFLVESRTAKVTKASVHAPLPAELFRVETFPEGAWVNEHRDGKVIDYIHRSKKGPRYILPYEFTGDNYEALLNSESPARPTPRSTK